MKRALLIAGWVTSFIWLYLGLVALEFYWNVPDWQPRFDEITLGISLWIAAGVLAALWLGRVTRDNFAQRSAAVLCLAMIALTIYVLPAEPLKPGLLGRESSSPLWYRLGRLGVPLLLSALLFMRWRKRQLD